MSFLFLTVSNLKMLIQGILRRTGESQLERF